MDAGRRFQNVALVGFMGSGKSTVGQILAELLGFRLIDTDRRIEEAQGRRVSEIFAQSGEAAFREMEARLADELESESGVVVATGGGMIVNPVIFESLRRHALIACLWASPETIHERVRRHGHRPLLLTPDPLAKIRELLAVRGPVYQKADLLVGVDFRTPVETARHIAQSFQRVARRGGAGE
jgi:shikimate kinase